MTAPSRSRRLSRALALAVLVSGLVGAYWLHVESELEWSPEALQTSLADLGPLAPALFVGIVALRPLLLLPSWVILSAGGILFGTAAGTLLGAAGGTLGALLAFFLARVLGREAVERRLSGAIARVDGYLGRRGPVWLAVFTALPVTPLTPVYYAAGLSSMRVLPFAAGAAAGLVPRCGLYAFFGSSLVEPDRTQLAIAGVLLAVAIGGAYLAQRWLLPSRPPAGEL